MEQAHAAGKLQFHGNLEYLSEPRAFAQYMALLRKAEWVVYSKPPFRGPERVLDCLRRYTHRVAISNNRLTELKDGRVSFIYKDYKHENRQRLMTLSADGFQRIRNYGLLCNRHRMENLARCRVLLGIPAPVPQLPQSYRERYRQLTEHDFLQCPRFQNGQMYRVGILPGVPPAVPGGTAHEEFGSEYWTGEDLTILKFFGEVRRRPDSATRLILLRAAPLPHSPPEQCRRFNTHRSQHAPAA